MLLDRVIASLLAWRSLKEGRGRGVKSKEQQGVRRVWNALREFRNTCKSFVLQKKKRGKK